jgi:hypothetical protein
MISNPYVGTFADDTKCIVCKGEMYESAELVCSATCYDVQMYQLNSPGRLLDMGADCYDV